MSFSHKLASEEYPAYAGQYLEYVRQDDIVGLLQQRTKVVKQIYSQITEEKSAYCYLVGKWSIKEVLLHLVDTERILSYRALSIARGEKKPLLGFEQDEYVLNSDTKNRTLASILEEFEDLRPATIALFKHLPVHTHTMLGTANGLSVSVRGIVAMICGHEMHHTSIVVQRYLDTAAQ